MMDGAWAVAQTLVSVFFRDEQLRAGTLDMTHLCSSGGEEGHTGGRRMGDGG